jgi:hypothetical protein
VDPRVRFPGPQPVGLSRSNVDLLLAGNRAYMVGRKTDGVRVVLFFARFSGKPSLSYLDRKLQSTDVFGPEQAVSDALFDGTVLDAELCAGRFVVFDCYAFAGRPCWDRNLLVRLRFAREAVALSSVSPSSSLLQLKRMVPFDQLAQFLQEPDQDGCPNDGLVFTPVQDRVTFKSSQSCTTLKFKRPEDHTCDFLVREVTDTSQRRHGRAFCGPSSGHGVGFGLVELWFTADRLRLFAVVPWTLEEPPEFERIWEFRVSAGRWQPVRLRPDKRIPNFKATVLDTLRCLHDGVRLEELL